MRSAHLNSRRIALFVNRWRKLLETTSDQHIALHEFIERCRVPDAPLARWES